MNEIQSADLVRQLSQLRIYQDYKRTFAKTTKFHLELSSIEAPREADHVRGKSTSRFCAIFACTGETCSACLMFHRHLAVAEGSETRTLKCDAGFTNTIVPVKSDQRVIGFLETGQVLLHSPSAERFSKIAARLGSWGVKRDLARLEDAYFSSRVVERDQYHAVVRLLEIFAEHLSLIASKIVLQQCNGDSLIIRRAKEYIATHQFEPITLEEIARTLNVSTFYFCRRFKQATGLTFVTYLNRLRIEKAKILLQNKNLRVSEIAYQVGFQSLTHFNRIFRKLVGDSPTEYRGATEGSKEHLDGKKERGWEQKVAKETKEKKGPVFRG